jgi:hypothetical protein
MPPGDRALVSSARAFVGWDPIVRWPSSWPHQQPTCSLSSTPSTHCAAAAPLSCALLAPSPLLSRVRRRRRSSLAYGAAVAPLSRMAPPPLLSKGLASPLVLLSRPTPPPQLYCFERRRAPLLTQVVPTHLRHGPPTVVARRFSQSFLPETEMRLPSLSPHALRSVPVSARRREVRPGSYRRCLSWPGSASPGPRPPSRPCPRVGRPLRRDSAVSAPARYALLHEATTFGHMALLPA